jgi:hypothetical protein
MRAVLLFALLAMGCKIDLDKADVDASTTGRTCKVGTSAGCVQAEQHSDLTWIKQNIFMANCFGSSCHTGATASGKLDLTDDPYMTLLGPSGTGVASNLSPSHKRVVPGDPSMSYLFFLIHGLDGDLGIFEEPPKTVGYMPMSNAAICCQKIDAVKRWIEAGAMND